MILHNGEKKFYFLPEGPIALDATNRQPCGFISHAHGDHTARHELIFCTPETESLCRHRLKCKPMQQFRKLHYMQPVTLGGLKLTAYPAGHCLGSAMLLAESLETGRTLLYTGDFKLGPSATSVEAVVPKADLLVIESTFGKPELRMPPREQTIARLLDEVRQAFDDKRSPVVFAYALGKGQEVTKILTDAGFKVQQYQTVEEISRIYEQHGMMLGDFTLLKKSGMADPDRVLVVPASPNTSYRTPYPQRTFMVSGWAVQRGAEYRFGVDIALPLSDHADYDDLLHTIKLCEPETVFPIHGAPEFVDRLFDLGIDARTLDRPFQRRLF